MVEREKHTLNDTTLDVSFEMPNRKDENTKTIEVAGLPRTTTKDSILNYFENKRRSGGGEVENVNLKHEAGVAFVTFKDIGGKLDGSEFNSISCYEVQVFRIILNRHRKLRTLTLIHLVVNPNIHEYCDKLGSFLLAQFKPFRFG